MQELGRSREDFAKALEDARSEITADPQGLLNGVTEDQGGEEPVVDEQPTQESEPQGAGEDSAEVQAAVDAGPDAGETQEAFQKRIIKMVNTSQRRLATERKKYESGVSEMEQLRQKAQAYDLLSQNPDALQHVNGLRKAISGPSVEPIEAREKKLRDSFKDEAAFDTFMEMVALYNDKNLMPQLQPVGDLVRGLVGRTIETDWNGLKGEYGDIDDYKDKAFELSRTKSLSLKDGLLLASGGEIVKQRKEANQRANQRKSLSTPGVGNGAATHSKAAKMLTKDDRIRMLGQGAAKLDKSGVGVPWLRNYLK